MLHVWRARLDSPAWPDAGALPREERERASRLTHSKVRRRWVAARWALRSVLAHHLEEDPAGIELRFGERGKPLLAAPDAPLRFNLSHSGELALVAVAEGREVGVDVQEIGSRRPASFYIDWSRREAIAKCHGVGLWAPLPDVPVVSAAVDVGEAFAATVAIAGESMPPLRQLEAEPGT